MIGDAELLRALGLALEGGGWKTMLITSDGLLRLRVWDASVPVLGETVSVACERDGAWFRSSTGIPMARCDDLPGAVGYVERVVGALVRPRTPA